MTERSITLPYDISARDPSFTSSTKNYKISYSLHEPTSSSSSAKEVDLPVLVLCHHFNGSRYYWDPQISDPTLSSYLKIALDLPGFSQSKTTPSGSPWSFDLAAESILVILDELSKERGKELSCVVIGDSMGGGPTGLRVGMRDHERIMNERKPRRVLGVVAVGTCAEEESDDFVRDYTKDAEEFAQKCEAASTAEKVSKLIDEFAEGMGQAGYTESSDPLFAEARKKGVKVIADSLKMSLANDEGLLEGKAVGETMKVNYRCLNHRKGLIGALASRPSPLGKAQVLVVHGTDDNAYPFERKYHERTFSAVGEANGELLVVQGGPHFATASHWESLDKDIVNWIHRKCL